MENLINFIFVFIFSILLTGCGVLFATGNWWNHDYATDEELWVHPNLSKVDAQTIKNSCSDSVQEMLFGIKNYSKLSNEVKKELGKQKNHEGWQYYFTLQEQCYLDHGFKFYPRGIKRNHPTVCFSESKKMPGCQSVFDIPIL
ncbi:hypothetical protein [Acinetobacter sp. ANC 5584]